ncbi:MAG: hypothetical protein KF832_09390 [Caldilineaceae bacterium]|nr:hypothetical protein [Caldilineaceae bacterium]
MNSTSSSTHRLFPPHLLHARWHTFAAAGYREPVTGVIYRGEPRPTCGMPLGGLDTGCIDLEANGMWGYSTIFNHLIEPRALLNLPILGLTCQDGEPQAGEGAARSWVLVADALGKDDTPRRSQSAVTFPPTDYTPYFAPIGLEGVALAESIDYWGHYPIVDLEFTTTAPVTIGMRAWSPFIPGDASVSMTPGAVFEIQIRNPDQRYHQGTIAFNFPGFLPPTVTPPADLTVTRQPLTGQLNGVWVQSSYQDDAWELGYVLATLDGVTVRYGGPLNADGQAWQQSSLKLPPVAPTESGTALTFAFALAPGASQTVRVVLAWHAPHWRAGGSPDHTDTHLFTHMAAQHYPTALATANCLAHHHAALLQRIIAWQEVLYDAPELPGWLADALINNLHLIPECSIWGQAQAPLGDWCRVEDGLFGLNECPRGCPQIECIPCSFYGNIPLVYFFPRAALSTLRGYKAYQFPDGRPPWIFGGCTATEPGNRPPYELSAPDQGYQTVLNGACYIVMVARYWQVTGDPAVLTEFWDSLKRCNDFSMNLRPTYGLSQVVAMPTPGTDGHGLGDTEWFEAPEPGWKGYVTHAGGVRMAQVQLMRRMADAVGDVAYREQCDAWLAAGAQALEDHLWTGDYYLNFNEPESSQKSDLIFGYQLDGQWVTDWHGVGAAFPRERVIKTLATLRTVNCALSQSGAVNYANPDGTPAKVGGYGTFSYFPPELFMLAMTFMYGGQRAFGLDLLHRCLENIVCRWGYTWDFPNTVRGDADTGQRAFGADYYQNMMLWAVPAALIGQDLTGPTQADGLIARLLQAGKS